MVNLDCAEKKLSAVKSIVLKYKLDDCYLTKINDIEKSMRSYKSKVVFIGEFSAGKSAMLNKLMGKDVLKVSQCPETAIATELYYDVIESCTLVKKDNTHIPVTSFDMVSRVDFDEYLYAVQKVESEFLEENKDIVFVDMPGLGSSIERHNKALLRYVENACAYVMVIDVENGTMHQSVIDFIQEIKQYHANLVIILSKCDKKTQEDIDLVKEVIQEQAEDLFDEKVPVECMSIYDVDAQDKFLNLISGIDMQAVFDEKINSLISEFAYDLIQGLLYLKKNLIFDEDELNEKLKKISYEQEILETEFNRESIKLHNNLFNVALPNVLKDIKEVLLDNAEYLTEMAMQGSDGFSKKVNDLIRPILVKSVNLNVEESFKEFIRTAEFSPIDDVDGDKVQSTAEEMFGRFYNSISDFKPKNNLDAYWIKKKGGIKAVLATLAIATDFIAPWMELLIYFLPNVVDIFMDYMRRQQLESLNNRMRNDIIPKIVYKLGEDMRAGFSEIEKNLLKDLKNDLDNALNIKKKMIEDIMAKSSEEKQAMMEQSKAVDDDIVYMKSLC